jgi:GAF domain-containing protein
MGPKEDEGTDLRAMLTVPKTNLPGAPTPPSGMCDAIGILFLGCAIGAVVVRAISDDMSPILTALIVFASLIIVCSPLFWIRIAKPIVRAVNIERRNIEKRDAANAAAARVQEFDARLGRALDMADSEEGVLEVVRRALERQGVSTRGEFLLADSSNAHLERVAVASPDDAPGCSVDSPQNCPAVGRGQTTLFSRDDALDACPKLAGRSFGPCSAVCVPVTVMGRAAGVLHMIDQPDHVPSANDLDMLESLARLTGAQLGMLRAMEKTTRQAATDALTGLANRRTLEDVALAVADLDHFKDLNDTHGHEVGDRALRLFARTMRDAVRPTTSSPATAARSSLSCWRARGSSTLCTRSSASGASSPSAWRRERPPSSLRASASPTRPMPARSTSCSRSPTRHCSPPSARAATASRSPTTTRCSSPTRWLASWPSSTAPPEASLNHRNPTLTDASHSLAKRAVRGTTECLRRAQSGSSRA